MKEALYYKKLKDNIVQCQLCPRYCVIKDGSRGNCGVRENQSGVLYSLVYGKPCAAHVDPIEKKPFYHFLPGSYALSIGTAGCNLHCLYCQNWEISQVKPEEIPHRILMPKDVIKEAKEHKCKSIAYTYTEPTIFVEYVLDTAKLAKQKGIKNVLVTNGYINEKPLLDLCKYIDGANVDLKAFSENFYKKISDGSLKPVLKTLKILKKKKVWVEITNLLVPKLNDNLKEIEKMCKWIRDNLGRDVPLHFSRFFPMYKMIYSSPITPIETLINARKIAEKYLNYVYVGNVKVEGADDTRCPKSKKLAIGRDGYRILRNNINKRGGCNGEKIAGVWK